MDVAGYLRRSNVLVVIGKGGVGKTTVAAALAALAAAAGLDVLLVSLDDAGRLGELFGFEGEIGYDDAVLQAGHPTEQAPDGPVPGRIRARLLTSDAALLDYLETHGLRRVMGRLVRAGAVEVVATAIPGLRAVLVLGKIRQLEQAKAADLIIVDAPATGHALSFLSSASGLAEAARGGPLHVQAEQVAEMVSDPARCEVVLVTLPEEMPVNEAIETAFRLEDEIGVALGPLVVNACFHELDRLDSDPQVAAEQAGVDPPPRELALRIEAAAQFRRGRQQVQKEQLARLAEKLALGRIELPYLFDEEVDRSGLATLARSLAAGIAGF
jgi:anion-transporting  ArsA/GET3 family ATPase